MNSTTVTSTDSTTRQYTVDALDQAMRIIQAVPDGRPKESYISAIRSFMQGRYSDIPPTPPDIHPIIIWAEALLDETYVPEKDCRCMFSPPCGDCVEYSSLREVVMRLKESIAIFRDYSVK